MEQEKLYVRPEMRITRFTDDMFTLTASEACDVFYEERGYYPDMISHAGCISATESSMKNLSPADAAKYEAMTKEEYRATIQK